MKNSKVSDISITNQEIFDFVDSINNIIMNTDNILQNAIILPISSSLNNADAIQHNKENNRHTINFNLFANGEEKRPDFISLVFKFPGTFNLYDYMQSYQAYNFCHSLDLEQNIVLSYNCLLFISLLDCLLIFLIMP